MEMVCLMLLLDTALPGYSFAFEHSSGTLPMQCFTRVSWCADSMKNEGS